MNKTEHRTKAKNIEKFTKNLDRDKEENIDWYVTGLFYEGMHYVDGYLSNLGQHPENHHKRKITIRKTMRNIYVDYRNLEESSRQARYKAYQFSVMEIADLELALSNIKESSYCRN